VETVDYPHPLGVHQVHRFQRAKLDSLNEWCPEYKLCSAEIDMKPVAAPAAPAHAAAPAPAPAGALPKAVPGAKAVPIPKAAGR